MITNMNTRLTTQKHGMWDVGQTMTSVIWLMVFFFSLSFIFLLTYSVFYRFMSINVNAGCYI